jgi:hypothetical protein
LEFVVCFFFSNLNEENRNDQNWWVSFDLKIQHSHSVDDVAVLRWIIIVYCKSRDGSKVEFL